MPYGGTLLLAYIIVILPIYLLTTLILFRSRAPGNKSLLSNHSSNSVLLDQILRAPVFLAARVAHDTVFANESKGNPLVK